MLDRSCAALRSARSPIDDARRGLSRVLAASALLAAAAAAQDCKTTLVSVDTGGGPLGMAGAGEGYLSDDGRKVVFGVLVHPQKNSPRYVYVRDFVSGITTRLDPPATVSRGFSGDGRIVLHGGISSGPLFARDLSLGTDVRVNEDSSGQPSNGGALWSAIDRDGRFVAFVDGGSNLVPNDTNASADVFVRDLAAGWSIERVSVSSSGGEGDGSCWLACAISADGRFVAFTTFASNLVPVDQNGALDVFLHDRATGQTELVSRSLSGGSGQGESYLNDISSDGRFVSFSSSAGDLVTGDTNGVYDGFVRDRVLGATVRVTLDASGAQLVAGGGAGPLSGDGSLALFHSQAIRVLPGDEFPGGDIYRRDLSSGAVERISVTSTDEQRPGSVEASDMTPDGRTVSLIGYGLTPTGYQEGGLGVFLRECPRAVARYGQAQTNSQGCEAWVSWRGVPSAGAGSGFLVRAQGELNQRPGRFLYGTQPLGPASTIPLWLQIGGPLRRLPIASTGGSPSGTDCSGTLLVDFNAWIAGGSDPSLVPGTTVFGQFWSRDDGFAPPDDQNFSDAVEITIQP